MKTIIASAAILGMSTVAAFAQIKPVVPEIDATAGVAAAAALVGVVVLLRERFKR